MPVVDFTSPFTIILYIFVLICLVFLGHEIKRSVAPAIGLLISTLLLVIHAVQIFIFGANYAEYTKVISTSMIFDFVFILISYLSYLWIDDLEAKHRNKKSIDNSLDWFWSKI